MKGPCARSLRQAGGLAFIVLLWGGGCESVLPRASVAPDVLLSRRAADDAEEAAQNERLINALVSHAKTKVDEAATRPSTQPATVDVLIISGGGDWGAFGAGVLKGWQNARGDGALPQFDAVTGVSTGALIAPFAFLGDPQSIERINTLYRNPKSDWALKRGLLFFWPNNESLFELPGLERALEKEVDAPMLERIARESARGRLLLLNSSNLDFGEMRAWDLGAAAHYSAEHQDGEFARKIMLASSAIPGAFPARVVSGSLYADGGVTGNILYGARLTNAASFWARWQNAYPTTPVPRLRYWLILNNQFRFPPEIIQRRWPDVMSRAMAMATQSATVNGIRHLFTIAQLAELRYGTKVEVRVMAIPEEWRPPASGVFKKETMNALADLGERMGADPTSWLREPP